MSKNFDDLTGSFKPVPNGFHVSFAEQCELWTVNGGYIAATMLRILSTQVELPKPATVDLNFIRPVRAGDAIAEVECVTKNRSSGLYEVKLTQEGRLCAIGRFWCICRGDGPVHAGAAMPVVAHPNELKTIDEVMAEDEKPLPAFWTVFEQKPIARDKAKTHGRARLLRWFKYRGLPAPQDDFSAVARTLPLIDVMGIPAVAQLYDRPFLKTLAPTIQLSCHARRTQYEGEWILVDAHCGYAADGLISTQVRTWGANGELLTDGMTQMVSRTGGGAYVEKN